MNRVNPKVRSAAWAGSLVVVVVWVAGEAGITVPPEVASALTVLVSTAAGWLRSAT